MKPADDIEDIDPGLARERTHLAWTRTVISFAAVGGALLKIHPIAGVPVLVLSVAIWELGRLPRPPGADRTQSRRLFVITVTVALVAVVALIISFVGHGPGLVITHQ